MRIVKVLCKNLNWIEANQENPLKDTFNEANLYSDGKSDSSQPVDKLDYFPAEDNIAKNSHKKDLSNADFKSEPDTDSTCTITPTGEIEQDPLDIFGTQSFDCTLCDQKFAKESNLEAHIFMKHAIQNNDEPYKCSHCAKVFNKESNLK